MELEATSIVLSPGYGNGPLVPDHWVQRWSHQLSTAVMVSHEDVVHPRREDWSADIVRVVDQAPMPVILVGHSLGVVAIAHAVPRLPPGKVRGAFLVALSDWERPGLIPEFDDHDFAPIPRRRLDFPVQLVASRNDPYCEYARAESFAADWGAQIIDAGNAGHVNIESGQGPWPEGLAALSRFVKTL